MPIKMSQTDQILLLRSTHYHTPLNPENNLYRSYPPDTISTTSCQIFNYALEVLHTHSCT